MHCRIYYTEGRKKKWIRREEDFHKYTDPYGTGHVHPLTIVKLVSHGCFEWLTQMKSISFLLIFHAFALKIKCQKTTNLSMNSIDRVKNCAEEKSFYVKRQNLCVYVFAL